MKVCNNLELVVICYFPLGRGLLTGQFTSEQDIPASDFKLSLKRFHGNALQQNLCLIQFLKTNILNKRDANHSITLAQLSLT